MLLSFPVKSSEARMKNVLLAALAILLATGCVTLPRETFEKPVNEEWANISSHSEKQSWCRISALGRCSGWVAEVWATTSHYHIRVLLNDEGITTRDVARAQYRYGMPVFPQPLPILPRDRAL